MPVDHIGLWPHVGVEELGDGQLGIAHCGEVDVVPGDECLVCGGIFGDAFIFRDCDGHNCQRGHLTVELDQCWNLREARRAPGAPEVEQHHLAAIVGKVDGGVTVREGKVWRGLARLRGARTPVAARRKRQWDEDEKKQKTREPHILIIRSGRAA